MNDPMQDIRLLKEAVERAIQETHMNMVSFSVSPGEDGIPDSVSLILQVDPAILSNQPDIDNIFNSLVADIQRDEVEDAKIKTLEDTLDKLKAFLEDDE